ncbi:SDR family NAD(P)-dependent oxidoreductase [Rodentibacter trehalosifermentans]|uniref:Short-chain dehydrogenase n=1 Tax=Rodentibacter trehalosifermentans TaxID=1908263 RepID=A0A1V3IV11_9PAST|nr:SDR family oxidoreductase [Rodentibacter trehalosifermentans]OOF45837.1 short-chain dehydrogenase [Rodentibacter trehalosifermentans]OOF46132.1 short-chain dehydrogenase [Rodentibacter trehalosifermentans]OOF48762.1 short-chain dehydrogenase [Rodentibacter trehalosifermentans]
MNKTALITGASNGIGLELAKIHAQKGGDLVLVARSQEKLSQIAQDLKQQFGVKVWTIAQDLARPQAAQTIFDETEAKGIQVDILINNAGVGGHGRFFERDLAKEGQMIQLNITALTELSHLYLQAMIARKSGKILNVSSTASFMPGPLQAVYYATKAYVTSFSQAIAEEVREFGVTVTALCPGAVATGFVEAGGLEDIEAWKHAKSPQSVAEYGYQAMLKGELVAFNESKLKFALEWIIPFLPRKMVLKMSRTAMEKTKS